MSKPSSTSLKKTPLNAAHRRLGGKMVDFTGWDMPVQFAGLIAEHRAVRTAAGLFDVSHMGEIEVSGPGSLEQLQRLTCNNAARLKIGQIHYSALMYPEGTFVDDLLVNRLGEEEFLLCVNAANVDKDFQYIRENVGGRATVANRSDDYAQIALQGPKSLAIASGLVDVDLQSIKYYWLARGQVAGVPAIIARTGYTGEDGFEFYVAPDQAVRVWDALLNRGQAFGLQPAGLGARDTLRLEAKMALYGNDIDRTTTVLEADLGWIVKLDKGDFLGREVLARQKEEGLRRILAGFEMVEKGIPRHGYEIIHDGRECGQVTSGSYAPFLEKNIGLGYVPVEISPVGTEIGILIRGREARARIVETPFYRRPK